jgi:VCBS repeat protein/type IX secretion system substrate protein
MKKSLILVFVLFSLFLSARIADYENLPEEVKASVIPDVEGRVLIDDTFLNNFKADISNTRDLPTVLDGFPVSYSVSNCYKGAVYTNMDEDDDLEIIYGVGTKIAAVNLDGSAVPGFPVSTTFYIWSSPACGDIDGDGIEEIVATSRNNTNANSGELYAYEFDGSVCTGFPVTMAGGGTMNACLSDLDDDGDLEIFVNVRNHPEGWVYAFQGDGTVIDGWPAALDYIPGASISVGDLDNDGSKEVIALSYNSLFVFDDEGSTLEGFPFTENGTTVSYSQPVLYDMDGDGDLEILYGACTDAGGKVFAFHHDGSMVEGWPNITSNWVFATVALGDIDGDGELDVVVGDQVGSGTASDYIYAWDLNGNDISGFPAGPTFGIYAQVAIADIDGDDEVEIMIDDNRFGIGYECYNHDGTHDDEWPLACGTVWSSTTMMITPVLGDFNNDGFLDITGAATDIMGWVVEAYVWTTSSVWNEDLAYSVVDGHNIQHDGVYPVIQDFFPEPPQNVIAEVIDFNSIMVSWDPPINNVPSGYNIYRDWELLGSTMETSFISEDHDEGIYNYQISAVYSEGFESEAVEVSAEIIFLYPANLTYEVIAGPEVILNWDFPVDRSLDAFVIYRDGEEIAQVSELTYTDTSVEDEVAYEYFVTAMYSGGYESEASNTVEVYVTESDDDTFPVIETRLLGNYPNPFNPSTTISFSLTAKDAKNAKLEIYDLKGQKLRTLDCQTKFIEVSEDQNKLSVTWDGKDDDNRSVPSGIYFYKLESGSYSKTRKMVLLK